MNVCNCFIILSSGEIKTFAPLGYLSARAVHDAVNGCSSDIHHLKLAEDNIESQSLDLIVVDAGGDRGPATELVSQVISAKTSAYVLLTVFW